MSEGTIRDAIVAVIRKHADFSSANVGSNDFRMLGSGQIRAVVVGIGEYVERDATLLAIENTWTHPIIVARQWPGQLPDALTSLEIEVEKVKSQLKAWQNLDAGYWGATLPGVQRVTIQTRGEAKYMEARTGSYAYQEMNIITVEMEIPTRSE